MQAQINDGQKTLLDAQEKHGYDDWYHSILMAAFERTKDEKAAVEIAEQIFKDHPKDTSEPAPDDADALFAER